MPTKPTAPNEPAVEIRPGVLRPDWSVVTTSAARQALRGRVTGRTGLLEHWSRPLDANADLVWQTVLRVFVRQGRPHRAVEIAAETRLLPDTVTAILHELDHSIEHLGRAVGASLVHCDLGGTAQSFSDQS